MFGSKFDRLLARLQASDAKAAVAARSQGDLGDSRALPALLEAYAEGRVSQSVKDAFFEALTHFRNDSSVIFFIDHLANEKLARAAAGAWVRSAMRSPVLWAASVRA